MEISRVGARMTVELEVAAAIPAGHEVVVLLLERPGAGWLQTSSAEAVLDRTAGVLHADLAYWTILQERGWPIEPPAVDPVAALGPGWRAKTSVVGRVLGTLVSTKDGGEQNHARTLLHLAPPEEEPGYRG